MANRSAEKCVNLALQGGGAHGAFTWGVLDRLLEEERVGIEAVTGASAGAMNAVVLADGFAAGCRTEARATLERFWRGVADAARTSPIRRSLIDRLMGSWSLDTSPGFLWFDMLSRLASPYDLNPLDINPLRELLAELVDFERARGCRAMQVFISATNVETGLPKIFDNREMTVDHVLASACLPYLFKAVEIDGVPYWDGGYMGNPPLWPLFDNAASDDVVIVEINPTRRAGAPRSAREILNRINEITFNASLLRELRAIDFVSRLIDDGRLEGTGYRRVLVHRIADADTLSPLGASSKLNAEWEFLTMLREAGRNAADRFLEAHYDDIGERSTVDLRALFQGEDDPLDGARIAREAAYRTRPSGAQGVTAPTRNGLPAGGDAPPLLRAGPKD